MRINFVRTTPLYLNLRPFVLRLLIANAALTAISSFNPAVASAPDEDLVAIEVEAHDLLHDHHDSPDQSTGKHSKLQQLAEHLNVPEHLLKTKLLLRKGAGTGSEHLQNLALLLGASHLIEMSLGPVGVGISASLDAPVWMTATVGLVGGVISVPGFDPLCMGLFALYTRKSFQDKVSKVRLFLTSWRKSANPFENAVTLVRRLQEAGQIPQGQGFSVPVAVGPTAINANFQIVGRQLRLASVGGVSTPAFTAMPNQGTSAVDLHLFPWEIRRVFKQLIAKRLDPKGLFFVESVQEDLVFLKPAMFELRDTEVARIFRCDELLKTR